VLGRTNLPTFPMAIAAIVALAKDSVSCNHNNSTIKQFQTIVLQG
jgi:hypothetical protein